MFNYFFKNVNTLFLTCALAFISIANAQEIHTVDNKGTMKTVVKPTIAERWANKKNEIFISPNEIKFFKPNNTGTNIGEIEHYDSGETYIRVIKAGTYRVSYQVTSHFQSTSPVQTNPIAVEYIIMKNRTNIVPGTKSVSYHKDIDGVANPLTSASDGLGTAGASRIINLGAGDRLAVVGRKSSGSLDRIYTHLDGSSFLVERIK